MYGDRARRKRLAIEVYEEEMQILNRMKSHSFDKGIPFRDFAIEAIKEKLIREGALPPTDKPHKK